MSDPKQYTIGWICAVTSEYVAAQEFLDEEHPQLASRDANDKNIYTLGRIGEHKVAIACLPMWTYGVVSAASVASDMLRTFTNIRFGLMVGIGGGVPTAKDIRLGDIVVSSVDYEKGAVFQYDFGQAVQGKAFSWTQHLDAPPLLLRGAVQNLEAKYERRGNQIDKDVSDVLDRNPRLRKYRRPDPATDRLYRKEVVHVEKPNERCGSSCGLNKEDLVIRNDRLEYDDNPKVHYGLIASGNGLIKDAVLRDCLAQQMGILCFEMEAAGLMNHFKCLVIRGICDYSDSHRNEEWQGYAAMAAAAYAKDLLKTIPPSQVEAEEKISKILSDVQEEVKQTRSGVESLKEDGHTNRIRNWLSPPDPSTNLNTALKCRNSGSGQWLLRDNTAYSTWKSERNSFLWLHGIPGCGKTILSSTVVEDLRNTHPDNYLYFYFDFKDNEKQHLHNAIRSLVSQLYYQRKDVRKYLDSLHSSCGDGSRQPSLESLCTTFQNMVEQSDEVWIILDALDECTTRKELLSWIRTLRNLQMNIHFLVTSRPEQDITATIESFPCIQGIIHIQSDLIKEDIRRYVNARVQVDEGLKRWQSRPDVQSEIEAALMEKADGMFRWVSCQLDVLENCLEYPSVQKALASLPTTLDETYARILANVPQQNRHYTTRILQFLTYSRRPLLIEEAVDAIAVRPAHIPRFDPKNRMPLPEEISRYCSSLVTVTKSTLEARTEIQLAHFSVKEYLTSDRLEGDISNDLLEMNARATIAEVCMAYLLSLDNVVPFEDITQKYPMAQYSAKYWVGNAVAVQEQAKAVEDLSIEIFHCEKAWKTCYRLFNHERPWATGTVELDLQPALYYASLAGLFYSVRMLLDHGADVNAQGGDYGNALQAASVQGHGKVVQILLDYGADIHAQGGYYGTALQAASSQGHEKVIKMLLNHGADINARGGESYENALQAASSKGHEKVVQILLDHGANVNVQGSYGNALHEASVKGHGKVVQILLDYEADINAQGGYYGNALQAAISRGHEKVVQMLLDYGADIHAQGGYYGNALQAASSQGHEEVVQMLLNQGADITAQGGRYGNALQAASTQRHEKVVQMLLDYGADVNAKGGYYGTALQAAASKGHEKVIQMLLDHRADINAQGGHFGNALQAASFEGHGKVVQMLLDHRADINAQGGYFGNALQAAASKGHEKVVQILIDNGATRKRRCIKA
ncbi:ankyrin repeat-containing domain protein [Hypoxylon sp. NC1633]|nr:ankyrin repeat-containing domain protein [Hypoxylon sp. NC1633]